MRILTRKIYRAFPELDKYEDEVCVCYMKRAGRFSHVWKRWFAVIFTLFTSWVFWLIALVIAAKLGFELKSRDGRGILDVAWNIGVIFVGTSFVWLPILLAFLVRDRMLRLCLRKQLDGVKCDSCSYSLLGLTIQHDLDHPSVHCPECGHRIILKDMGLTEADIDPSLIGAQA